MVFGERDERESKLTGLIFCHMGIMWHTHTHTHTIVHSFGTITGDILNKVSETT